MYILHLALKCRPQWRNKVAVSPRASIPKGPPLPPKNLKNSVGQILGPHSAGPACNARLARPIVTPLVGLPKIHHRCERHDISEIFWRQSLRNPIQERSLGGTPSQIPRSQFLTETAAAYVTLLIRSQPLLSACDDRKNCPEQQEAVSVLHTNRSQQDGQLARRLPEGLNLYVRSLLLPSPDTPSRDCIHCKNIRISTDIL